MHSCELILNESKGVYQREEKLVHIIFELNVTEFKIVFNTIDVTYYNLDTKRK